MYVYIYGQLLSKNYIPGTYPLRLISLHIEKINGDTVTSLLSVITGIDKYHTLNGLVAQYISHFRLLFQTQLNYNVCCSWSNLPLPSVGCQGGQLLNTHF